MGTGRNDKYIASIDLGSHTARFLLCRILDYHEIIKPVIRKRYYTNLAEGFKEKGRGIIGIKGINRAVKALEDFSKITEEYNPKKICAAATGIFRRADNSNVLLNLIRDKTGIDIKIVPGEKEALFTLKGVVHALNLTEKDTILFDLGGATTEFIYGKHNDPDIQSLPIGAFILTDRYLNREPLKDSDLNIICQYIDNILKRAFSNEAKGLSNTKLIGSGGTVTSLAAMINRMELKDIRPEKINGLTIRRDRIENLLKTIMKLSISERLKLPGIDRGRAEVILAGTIAVLRIMYYFGVSQLTVSYSDILEGLIISYLQGEIDE
jgi:exopolyphosphatase/guanosine-5'-triphosphate,3'-diphosphate pyrophosphatase